MSGQTAAPALRPPLHTSSRHRAWRRRRRSRRRRCGARAVVGHRLGPLGRDSLGVAAAPCGQRRPHVCLRRRLPRRAHARRLVRRAVRPSRPAHEQQQRSAASARAACPQPLLPPPPAQTVARSHLFDVSLVSLALYAVNVACIIGGRPWGSNHRPGADGRADLPLRLPAPAAAALATQPSPLPPSSSSGSPGSRCAPSAPPPRALRATCAALFRSNPQGRAQARALLTRTRPGPALFGRAGRSRRRHTDHLARGGRLLALLLPPAAPGALAEPEHAAAPPERLRGGHACAAERQVGAASLSLTVGCGAAVRASRGRRAGSVNRSEHAVVVVVSRALSYVVASS